MVKCVLLTTSTIKEIKIRATKNIINSLEKKAETKGNNFKEIISYKYNKYSIHIYGYIDGDESIINSHFLPDINDETILYGDLIATKYQEDNIIDLTTSEYEEFYINYIEGNNLEGNNKENIKSDYPIIEDDINEDDEIEDFNSDLIMNDDLEELYLDNDENYSAEEEISDIESESDIITKEYDGLDIETYDYSYQNI